MCVSPKKCAHQSESLSPGDEDVVKDELGWPTQYGILVTAALFIVYIRPYIFSIENILVQQSAVLGGGLLSGSLHALTGPDHVAAILPFVVGQRWYLSSVFGAIWGLGHGISACFMGVCGYYIKGSMLFSMMVPQLLGLADYAVGATLIVIGLMGIHEARVEEAEVKAPLAISDGEDVEVREMSTKSTATVSSLFNHSDDALSIAEEENIEQMSVKDDDSTKVPSESNLHHVKSKMKVSPSVIVATIFINGALLGLSWDGLPSLSPALAMDAWSEAMLFFLSYLVGTVITMAITAAIIGESTRWLGSVSNINLPKRLALASSVCAIAIGVSWIVYSLVKFIEVTEDERYDGKLTWSWIACFVMGIGSPLAVVGVVVMTVLKELGIVIRLPRPCGDRLEEVCPFTLWSDHVHMPYSAKRFRKGEIHVV
jgi:hypothetical protein